MGLHIINGQTDLISNRQVFLTTDHGYPEIYQYVKMAWIVLLIGLVAIRTSTPQYFTWSLTFGYLLLDDALRIHEIVGGEVIGGLLDRYALTTGSDTYELGQALFALPVGGLLLALILITYYVSNQTVKITFRTLLVLLFSFAFFSILVDAAGMVLDIRGRSFIEESGELFTMSAIFSFSLGLYACVNENKVAEGMGDTAQKAVIDSTAISS